MQLGMSHPTPTINRWAIVKRPYGTDVMLVANVVDTGRLPSLVFILVSDGVRDMAWAEGAAWLRRQIPGTKLMISPAMLRVVFRELTTSARSPRAPEPDLVMDDRNQVEAYIQAGLDGGEMALVNCRPFGPVLG